MNEAEIESSVVHVESGAIFNLSATINIESVSGLEGQGACHGGTGGGIENASCSYGSMYHPSETGFKAKGKLS